LQDGTIQTLLPGGHGECGGLSEIYDQAPFFGDPRPCAWGVFGMDEKNFQE
jgi:hypothetical protein